jgi:hypothetical protein
MTSFSAELQGTGSHLLEQDIPQAQATDCLKVFFDQIVLKEQQAGGNIFEKY